MSGSDAHPRELSCDVALGGPWSTRSLRARRLENDRVALAHVEERHPESGRRVAAGAGEAIHAPADSDDREATGRERRPAPGCGGMRRRASRRAGPRKPAQSTADQHGTCGDLRTRQ